MSTADNIRAIVDHLIKPTRFYGFYPFEVTGFSGTDPRTRRPDLVPLNAIDGLHPLKAVDRIPGFTGVGESYTAKTAVTNGTVVLVGFWGGDPNRPFVAFTLSTIPTALDVCVSSAGAGRFTVRTIPAAGTAVPVALAPGVSTYITALKIYVDAVAAALVAAIPAASGAITAAQSAYAAATAGASVAAQRLSSE